MVKKNILILSILVGLFLSFLPSLNSYNTTNIILWTQLSLSFIKDVPVFYANRNPGSFFTLIFLIPLGTVYAFSQSIYVSVVVLKLILLTFFILFVLLMDRVFDYYNVNEKTKNFLNILILLNPGILFVTFIWNEVEIIPVFFVTLSYYVLRVEPFRKRMVNELLSVISLMISIFFFLYPLVFIPSIILYSRGRKDKIVLSALFIIVGLLLLLFQVKFIYGYIYDYFGSLTGSVPSLTPSQLPTGLFYFFPLVGISNGIVELTLILIASIVVPIFLYLLKYEEQKVLYIVSAIFIFISIAINMDNFLFIVPFVFLAALNKSGITVSRLKILLTTSLLIIPVLFAPLVYYFDPIFGIFYWLYPLLHVNVPTIAQYQRFLNLIYSGYNFFFMLLLFVTVTLTLWRKNKTYREKSDAVNTSRKTIYKTNIKIERKIVAFFVALIVVSVPLSFYYNQNDNSVSISDPSNFPLIYFNPVFHNVPLGSNSYYSINNNILSVPPSTSMILNRNLGNEYFLLNTTFVLSKDFSSYIPFAITDLWSLQKYDVFNNSALSEYTPTNVSEVGSMKSKILPLANETQLYYFNGQSSVLYHIPTAFMKNNTFVLFFKSINKTLPQSVPISVGFGNMGLEIAIYPSFAVIALYTPTIGWVQTGPIALSSNSDWEEAVLNITGNSINLGFNGVSFSGTLPTDVTNVTVHVGNPHPYQFIGYSTALFYYNNSFTPYFQEISATFGGISYPIEMSGTYQSMINVQFTNSPVGSTLSVGNRTFTGNSASFLTIQKLNGSGTFDMKVNKMVINYTDQNGFYLVPAFLAFYLAIVFVIFMVWYIFANGYIFRRNKK